MNAIVKADGSAAKVELAPGQAMPPPTLASSAQCDAAAAQFAVGQVANGDLASQAREKAGATRVRLLKPNDRITMEFDAMRLNLEMDDAGRVLKVRCG